MDIVSIPVLEHRRRIITQSSANVRHICIVCKSVVFLSDDSKRQELFDRGRKTAEEFLLRLRHGLPVGTMLVTTPIIPE